MGMVCIYPISQPHCGTDLLGALVGSKPTYCQENWKTPISVGSLKGLLLILLVQLPPAELLMQYNHHRPQRTEQVPLLASCQKNHPLPLLCSHWGTVSAGAGEEGRDAVALQLRETRRHPGSPVCAASSEYANRIAGHSTTTHCSGTLLRGPSHVILST